MPYDSRIFGMLEMELSKHLTFTICGANGEPLADCKRLRVQDGFDLTLWVRNDTGFPFRGIRGTVSPSVYTRFKPVDFHVGTLEAQESVPLVRIQGLVTALPPRVSLLDHIATVSVSASADLSSVVFQEWDKPVAFAHPSEARPATDLRPRGSSRASIAADANRPTERGRSIPLLRLD